MLLDYCQMGRRISNIEMTTAPSVTGVMCYIKCK